MREREQKEGSGTKRYGSTRRRGRKRDLKVEIVLELRVDKDEWG
jgi:hypothetical protein